MKRRIGMLVMLAATAAFVIVLVADHHTEQSAEFDPQDKPWKSWRPGGAPAEKPDDWFTRQRAYPYWSIPDESKRRALNDAVTFNALHRDDLRMAEWEPAGPTNVGGRITDMAVHEDHPNTIYIGAADGGVLKSTDAGVTWTPMSDELPSLSAGALAVHPNDVNTVYLGTGEANASGDTYAGNGVYRSVDGGASWEHLGLDATRKIGRIVIDPINPNRVFVAAMGGLYSTNPERGLYRSTDGGTTWDLILFVNDSTGVVDVAVNPIDPDIIYAASWERIRRTTMRQVGGYGSGIHKSTDGGDTWTLLAGGLPNPGQNVGRIGITLCTISPNVLYAVYCDHPGYFMGVYKTTNGGSSWNQVNDNAIDDVHSSFGWYFGQIRVAPWDPDRIFVLGVPLYRSLSGGSSWSSVGSSMHVDHHAIYIHPTDFSLVYCGNDGGFYRSTNGGSSWTKRYDLPITQFYAITVDEQRPWRLYGGTQDNSTNRTWDGDPDDWDVIYYGDGFYTIVDPTNSNVIYAEYQYGGLAKSTNGGGSWSGVTDGISSNDRRNWSTPVVMDPNDNNTLYYGTYRVYRTTNGANYWNSISGDLTNGPGGGNLTFGTLTTIDVAPTDPDVVYAGTDDGNVWVTTNGGGNWTNVSGDLLDRWVTRVSVDPTDASTAYVTFSGYKYDEEIPHIFRTTDAGANWTDISSNLPPIPLNDVIVDPDHTNQLFVASDAGVYWSWDLGGTWAPLGVGLPNSSVHDLHLHNGTRKLVAGTHGRSMFTLDLAEIVAIDGTESASALALRARPNPLSTKATVTFGLDEPGRVVAEIFDVSGRLITRLADDHFAAGSAEIEWDAVDDAGRRVSPGVYFCRVKTTRHAAVERLIVMP